MAGFHGFRDVPPPSEDSPWVADGYAPDLTRLRALLAACIDAGAWRAQQGGDIGLALDLWVADELRRAGYEPDAVWPRASDPRVLPAAVARAIGRLPATMRASPAVERIAREAGATSPVVHGEFFPKSVDVLVADWDRGVELMVSTKAMVSSFGKNLTNRWEEFVGDLRNVRGRFPLAVLGVVYMADASIVTAEPSTYARLLDMLRKLRVGASTDRAYDATCLILAVPGSSGDAELVGPVPADLAPRTFFETLLAQAFARLPVAERAGARALYARRALPTAELSEPPETE
jgi:hypothetical protein